MAKFYRHLPLDYHAVVTLCRVPSNCQWHTVTGLLIHIIPFAAEGELFCLRVNQPDAKLRSVRSIIKINVSRLPVVIEIFGMIFDQGVVLRDEITIWWILRPIAEIGHDQFSGRVGSNDISLFGLTEVPQKHFPVVIVGAVDVGIVNCDQSEHIDLPGWSLTTIPNQ